MKSQTHQANQVHMPNQDTLHTHQIHDTARTVKLVFTTTLVCEFDKRTQYQLIIRGELGLTKDHCLH